MIGLMDIVILWEGAQIEAAGGRARAFEVDARSEEQTAQLFGQVAELGVLEVCVFNIGANVRHAILDTTARVYFKGERLLRITLLSPPPPAVSACDGSGRV
jgi:hypothetical protein